MYFLDLHGNSKKKETAPDGSKDENVFDIMQGVVISIFVKIRKLYSSNTCYADVFGCRKDKYHELYLRRVSDLNWKAIDSRNPLYLYTSEFHQDFDNYSRFMSTKDAFLVSNTGVKTHRDHFAIGFQQKEIIDRVITLRDSTINDKRIYEIYHLTDTRDWRLTEARNRICALTNPYEKITTIDYRPFDTRYTYYDSCFIELIKHDVFQHMFQANISIVCTRQTSLSQYKHCFVSDRVSETCFISNKTKETAYIFPMWLYNNVEFLGAKHTEKKPNIKPEVFAMLKARYATQNTKEISPEAFMGYIYAVLHSPTYREKYKDFLKTDFPRIPFCDDYRVFEQMSALGWELINAHLMKSEDLKQRYPDLGTYTGIGSNEVSKLYYTDSLQRLHINDTQYFDSIPEPVYMFHIGGYQVLHKYLKDRKGRELTLDEINNVEFIAKILAFTMDTMQRID
ncbi:MAG: type ISP restriction/modification enzyme, partial [Candidatus Cloacimonadaceae bacterium]|nr:type ISP restriction/modification enzyme [Candidatus Cloacimonadaceae bacterium]